MYYWVRNNGGKLILWEHPPLGDCCAGGGGTGNTCTLGVKYLFTFPHITVNIFRDETCSRPICAHELLIGRKDALLL
jgi:hypothetical protein